ncbi:MAG: efflux RND transporter periplasmic adaptor subunit [Lachnospiraceae bacterium]|nr:efflux RND transporter periplasmic adaptor subunit [Lachnospiraceae bacterium]
MKKGKLVRATAIFFAMMLVFTLLSRAADASGIAVVTTEKPASRILSHTISATGKVVQNQEMAVTTVSDLRVSSIAISEGSRVSEGDLLFELDEDYLDEQILYQEQELEKLQLTLEDIKSQQSVSSQQKANEQASASEQYSFTVASASLSLSRAKEALQEAKDALAAYREKSGTTTTADSTVETALEQAVEEKTESYISAQQDLLTLQWKIEDAVSDALKAAQSSASLTGNSSVKTQASVETYTSEEAAADVPAGAADEQTEEAAADTAGIVSEDETGMNTAGETVADVIEEIATETAESIGQSETGSSSGGITIESVDVCESGTDNSDDSGSGAGTSDSIGSSNGDGTGSSDENSQADSAVIIEDDTDSSDTADSNSASSGSDTAQSGTSAGTNTLTQEELEALEEGALSTSQQVVTGSDKSISDGSRVRVE